MNRSIQITALRADHTPYRWWESVVEYDSSNLLITSNKARDFVYESNSEWQLNDDCRMYYWTDRPYNLMETYDSDGHPKMIYLNIASPIQFENSCGNYHDYELDVQRNRGCSVEVLDEDEFLTAIKKYKYSDSFVKECKASLALAIELAEQWKWSNDIYSLREFG